VTIEIRQLVIEAKVTGNPVPTKTSTSEREERRLIEKICQEVLLVLRDKQEYL